MANKTLQLKIGNTTYRSSVDNTLTNEDLNNVTLPGLYNAGGSNSVTNKPSGIDHFGLLVIHRASGSYYIQIIYNDSKSYRRFCTNGTWSNWTEDKLTDTTYTSLKNPYALTLKFNSGVGTTYDGSSAVTYDITKTALGMNKVDNTADVDKSVKHAKTADSATTATTLGSATIGSNSCGIYLNAGKPVKMNATVGNANTPIYFLNGAATACSLTKASVGLGSVDNTSDAKKTVDRANKLKLLASSRPDSLNFDLTKAPYLGNLTYNIASSSTKVGKCPKDASVMTFSWDSSGWGSQMAISDESSPRVYIRGAKSVNNASVWDTEWKTLAFTSDIPTSFAWGKVTGKPSTFPPSSHTHAYLPLSGGAMKGNISYAGSKSTYEMIKFIDNKADTYGNGISIGGGGLTVIGGGESASAYVGSLSGNDAGGQEQLVLCNDEGIDFYVGCQSGISSAKHCSISASGAASFVNVYNAVYNDYAEFFPRGEATEPGDIVALDLSSDHESYIKATATSKIVAGVHSDEYAMLIGGDKVGDGNYVEKNIEKYIPVSLCGRVYCKCVGKIHRGDTIVVSDIPGIGRAKLPNDYVENTQIVGYAVDEDMSEEIRRVRIRVKG